MILLDTNVISECMRPAPDRRVVEWLDSQPAGTLYASAIARAEIELGIAGLPGGRRKRRLRELAAAMFSEEFSGHCLPFDEAAALQYAPIVVARRRAGRPIAVEDAQIAAIAVTRGMTLATRNVADFEGVPGLTLVNPWSA